MSIVIPHVPVLLRSANGLHNVAWADKCIWKNSSNQQISDPGQVSSYLSTLVAPNTLLGPFDFDAKDGSDNALEDTWHYLDTNEDTTFGGATHISGEVTNLHMV